ncbi:MAG TPA: hypothetical protein V6C78_30910 [Crinalium sp.]
MVGMELDGYASFQDVLAWWNEWRSPSIKINQQQYHHLKRQSETQRTNHKPW